jgi:hypothetical protein
METGVFFVGHHQDEWNSAPLGLLESAYDRRTTMHRILVIVTCTACLVGIASAQTNSESKQPNKSEHNTGRTVTPEAKGHLQPQGWTGPVETGSGGAPAESPQGESPPSMQPAPEGSSKTTVEPDKK